MKKLFIVALSVLCLSANFVMAQTKEEMQKSQERYEKLVKMLDKKQKSTGDAAVDSYVNAVCNSGGLSIVTTEQLNGLYYRSLGQTKDGVTDITVKKPSVKELTKLSVTIGAQAVTIATLTKEGKSAAEAAKKQKNPMKAAKMTKALAFTADIYPVIAEESTLQVKAIAEMIKTAKSADNL